MRSYITTTIPYGNGRPHIGHALELVQADVLARHGRARGNQVRFHTGTDDNALKNVQAAEAAGQDIKDFITRNDMAFLSLGPALSLSVDDVIRTGFDPRHRPGVEKLWRACADDLYRRAYEGLYCTGCEQFFTAAELADGLCPEHGTVPEVIAEENWFFRLSRYADPLRAAISSGALRVEPAGRRNEVLAFIDAGLADFSVSRPAGRARGWGVRVPDDPSQVIYVWWDALGNYITALGYGSDETSYQQWWAGPESGRRVHLLGKGVLRFHAVYWPAMLVSAGLPLPTDIFVHDYLTADGHKISKSGGVSVAGPEELAASYGVDALRWWLLREVPRVGDADFTIERMVARADDELANGIGNLVNRVVSMIHRYRGGVVPTSGSVLPAAAAAPGLVDVALADFDFRGASAAVWQIAHEANGYVSQVKPWALARSPGASGRLDEVLGSLYLSCRVLATELTPFLPDASTRITAQLYPLPIGRLPDAVPAFRRLAVRVDHEGLYVLFRAVYGLSNAETHSWSGSQTWAFLAVGDDLTIRSPCDQLPPARHHSHRPHVPRAAGSRQAGRRSDRGVCPRGGRHGSGGRTAAVVAVPPGRPRHGREPAGRPGRLAGPGAT